MPSGLEATIHSEMIAFIVGTPEGKNIGDNWVM